MSNVLRFRRRGASKEVIDKLVNLGYLNRPMRHNAGAIENALARLQDDLCRSQVISRSAQLENSDDRNQTGLRRRCARRIIDGASSSQRLSWSSRCFAPNVAIDEVEQSAASLSR